MTWDYVLMDKAEVEKASLSKIVRGILINELVIDRHDGSVAAMHARGMNKTLYAELDRRESIYKSK